MAGSIRGGSLNRRLLSIFQSAAEGRPDRTEARFLEIRRLPFYDGDRETENVPPEVEQARQVVGASDGLVIATPEYNGAPSGVLQNALDWLSRPWGDSALTGKPVLTLSASPGPGGARAAQHQLREILLRSGARPVGDPFAVPRAAWLWEADLTGPDSPVATRLAALLDALPAVQHTAPSA